MNEEWKQIVGYEGLYEISNFGRVKSIKRQKSNGANKKEIIRKPELINGYLRVNLFKNNSYEKIFIHRLVASAFIPNPNNYPNINHKDENPLNNNAENLEWCTTSYNNSYGTRLQRMSITQGKTVLQYDLNKNFIKEWHSVGEVERILGISHSHISQVCNGLRNTTGGFIWKYK